MGESKFIPRWRRTNHLGTKSWNNFFFSFSVSVRLSRSFSLCLSLTLTVSLFLSPSVCPFLSVSASVPIWLQLHLSRYSATLQFWTYFWLAVSLFTISAIVFMSAHWQQTSVPLFVLSFFVWECPSDSLVHYWGIGPLYLSANTRCLVMFQLLLSFTFPALISAHPSSCQWRPIYSVKPILFPTSAPPPSLTYTHSHTLIPQHTKALWL